jgi:hypothetical protein
VHQPLDACALAAGLLTQQFDPGPGGALVAVDRLAQLSYGKGEQLPCAATNRIAMVAGQAGFGEECAAPALSYSGAQLEGVVSHPGGRFHVHYAAAALEVSGHVDAYAVASGSILKLPL